MRRALLALVLLAGVGFAAWWGLTATPAAGPPAALAAVTPDLERGEWVFNAAGCASCHSAEDAEGDARLVLSGGRRFPSDFGTFIAPNISTDPVHGIGGWTDAELIRAITEGVSPEGEHYYPAFPYLAYSKADAADIVSLVAFLRTLPASDVPSGAHEVGFPYDIRRNIGIWKRFFAHEGWVLEGELSSEVERGRYLVEALGHCGECHTPRSWSGGLLTDRWLAGAPSPSGRGTIPNITPGGLSWSEAEIADFLESGFTPEFDTAGGLMVEVIENTSRLTDEDRAAIAAYLKAVPPLQ